jgi:hypothetical protein
VVPPPCAGGEPKQYLQKQKLHKQTILFISFFSLRICFSAAGKGGGVKEAMVGYSLGKKKIDYKKFNNPPTLIFSKWS